MKEMLNKYAISKDSKLIWRNVNKHEKYIWISKYRKLKCKIYLYSSCIFHFLNWDWILED